MLQTSSVPHSEVGQLSAAHGSLFEALYRVRRPTGPLHDRLLRGCGVDPSSPATHYTAAQWRSVLQVYREHLFPTELDAQAWAMLGRALADAWVNTLVGRLVALALPMLSVEQLLRRWPRFVRMGRTDVELEVTVHGTREALIRSVDPVEVPMELNLGLLEAVFEAFRVRPVFRVERDGAAVLVHVRW